MFRASLAGLMLTLSASTAFATDISFATTYLYETSSAAAAAAGTTVTTPGGGLGNVGGLCSPSSGSASCPALDSFHASHVGPLTSGLINFNVPSQSSVYLLQLTVTDDSGSAHGATPVSFPANTPGDIFQVILDGTSIGTTSAVGITGSIFSTGTFSLSVSPGEHSIRS